MSDTVTISKKEYDDLNLRIEQLAESQKQTNEAVRKVLPIVEVLGGVLLPRKTATERLGLHRNTLTSNDKIDKFSELGQRKTYITIGELSVVKKHKKRPK